MLMVVARYFFIVPMLRARRYTQVRVSRKIRHFGRDAEMTGFDLLVYNGESRSLGTSYNITYSKK